MKVTLYDTLPFDEKANTALSYRDGVLKYLGSEIGIEPSDKVFSVYRSPATVSNSALLGLNNLPITDDHVSLDYAVNNNDITGKINNTKIVDYKNDDEKSTLAIQNKVFLNQKGLDAKVNKSELSLGYNAILKKDPTGLYDFLQENIQPHHLAMVEKGRNGKNIRFIDGEKINTKKENNMKLNLYDADGDTPNFQMIMELVQQLPQAIAKLPIKEVQKLVPILQKVEAQMQSIDNGEDPTAPTDSTDNTDPTDSDNSDPTTPTAPTQTLASNDVPTTDNAINFKDSKEFADAVSKVAKKISDVAIKDHTFVISKAKNFLDDNYDYINKSLDSIMLDAVKTQYKDTTFQDTSELKILFKHLKPLNRYENFADGKSTKEVGFIDIEGIPMNNKENT